MQFALPLLHELGVESHLDETLSHTFTYLASRLHPPLMSPTPPQALYLSDIDLLRHPVEFWHRLGGIPHQHDDVRA